MKHLKSLIDLHAMRPSESLDGYLELHPDSEATFASPLVHPSGALIHASDVYACVALLLDDKTSGGAGSWAVLTCQRWMSWHGLFNMFYMVLFGKNGNNRDLT